MYVERVRELAFAFAHAMLTSAILCQVFQLPNLNKPVYVAEGLSFLPSVLTADYAPRRSTAKEALTEILVADLGDITAKSPYLIVSL